MLKRSVNYTNFDGEAKNKTFYFNLTKTELLELDGSAEGGLAASLQRIVDSQEGASLIAEFKKIILLAYGERSDDGDRFVKSDDIREAFSQTAAFDALFMELAQDDKKASDFILGLMPAELTSQMQDEINKSRPVPTPNVPAQQPIEMVQPVIADPSYIPPAPVTPMQQD